MRNVLTIAVREFTGYFISPMAYVAMFFFLGVCGLIFVLSTSAGPPKADMTGIFHSMVFLALLLAPVITMGLLAQETNSGTYELLMTKPVRDVEVVLGKWLGAAGLYLVIMLISLEFPLIYEAFGKPDWGQVLSGYLGVVLCGLGFTAVGIFASSLTSNQIAAWLTGTFMLLFFWLIGFLQYGSTNWLGELAKRVSVLENYNDFERGTIDATNLLYFVSLCAVFLFLTVRSLESRRTV